MFVRNRITRTAIAFALAAGITMGISVPAFADGEVIVDGHDLGMTTPTVGDFTEIELDGTQETTNASVTFSSIIDATGTGAGWHIDATATQLAEWNDAGAGSYVGSGRTIPVGALKFSALTFSKVDTTSNTVPSQTNAATAIDSAGAVTTVKIASAAVDSGMGSYSAAGTMSLTVPASTYATTYKSTVTLSQITAP